MNARPGAGHPYRWFLHVLVILYYTMGFVVRFAWPPVISVAAPDLGMSMSSAGLYISAFYIGYVLIHIPGGILSDRFGVRVVIAAALIVEAVSTFGVGIAPDFTVGFACRVLTGLGAGAIYSACVRYVFGLFPPREAGLAFGLMMMAPAGVGVILPNILMPLLSDKLGWRMAFQAISILVLGMGVIAFLVVRDTPSGGSAKGSFLQSLRVVLREKNLVYLACAGFWLMWIMVGFVSWGNTYIEGMGFTKAEGSQIMMIYGVAGIVASPLGGILAQKAPSPKLLFASLFVMLALGVWFFGNSEGLVTLGLFSAVVGFALGLTNPLLPYLASCFAGKGLTATAGGVTGCIYQIGAIVGPWLMGLSVDLSGSFASVWILMVAGAGLGILCLIPMGKPKRE